MSEELFKAIEKVPTGAYLGMALASIAASIALFAGKKSKDSAIFVGLWAPTFLALGALNKISELAKDK